MTWKIFFSIIDAISPFVTIGFGIYGTLNDTKPKDGKMTRPAKIAICGIIISGLISAAIKIGGINDKFNEQKQTILDQQNKIIEQKKAAAQKEYDDSLKLSFQNQVVVNLNNSLVLAKSSLSVQDSIAKIGAKSLQQIDSVGKLQKVNLQSQLKIMDYQKASQFPVSNLTQDIIFSVPIEKVVHSNEEMQLIKQLTDKMMVKYPNYFKGTPLDINFGFYISTDTLESFISYPSASIENKFYKIAKQFYSLPYFKFDIYNSTANKEKAEPIAHCDYNLRYTNTKAQCWIAFERGFVILHYLYSDFNFDVYAEGGDTLNHLDQFKGKYLRFGACCFDFAPIVGLDEKDINVLVFQLRIKNTRHVLWNIEKVALPNNNQVFYKLNFY